MNTPTTAPKQGFALVIALSLMAFVLLLLLSITTLVQVETSVSRLNKEQLAAKQNALLALNMAIGQLQKYAGPDKRSTASAQLLNVDNPKYIGIWPSDTTTSMGAGLANGEAVWMVSNSSVVTPATVLDNPITLRKYKKSGDPIFAEVQAGIMPLTSNDKGSSGGYAWWVDDESLKASLFQKSRNVSFFL